MKKKKNEHLDKITIYDENFTDINIYLFCFINFFRIIDNFPYFFFYNSIYINIIIIRYRIKLKCILCPFKRLE